MYTPPKGYTLDSASGLYYHILNVSDAQTGQKAQLVSWFNPATGEINKSVNRLTVQAPVSYQQQSVKKKKSHTGLILILLVLILLIAAGVCAWQLGWLDKLFDKAPAQSSTQSGSRADASQQGGAGSQSLPKASDFNRDDSSSSIYTAPSQVPENLYLNEWYLAFEEIEDNTFARPNDATMLNFWKEGRFTIAYVHILSGPKFIDTSLYGGYTIEGNKIICTVNEFLEAEPVQNFTAKDFSQFIFEVTPDGIICTQGDSRVPLKGFIFHPEE